MCCRADNAEATGPGGLALGGSLGGAGLVVGVGVVGVGVVGGGAVRGVAGRRRVRRRRVREGDVVAAGAAGLGVSPVDDVAVGLSNVSIEPLSCSRRNTLSLRSARIRAARTSR